MAARIFIISSLLILLECVVDTVMASHGDRSYGFSKCLTKCLSENCTNVDTFIAVQPTYLRMLGWDCPAECKYVCMWVTVEYFRLDNLDIPQFFGKWPFVRILGIQEPASMLFSVLNGLGNLVMNIYFRRRVPRLAPMYFIWNIYAVVAMNAWLWSAIFHTRDNDFTEMMDYFSAFLLVLFSLYTIILRVFRTRQWLLAAVSVFLVSYFVYHVYFLAFVRFDYGYNMRANIAFGLTNIMAWLVWSGSVYKRQRYAWKAFFTSASVGLLLFLEVRDFPPLYWTLDAHALWHAGTIPLPFLFWQFITEDCLYLLKHEESSQTDAIDGKQSEMDGIMVESDRTKEKSA